MIGDWRRLYSEELHGLYCSSITSGVIKWRRMRRVWNVARMGGSEMHSVLARKHDHLQVLDFDWLIVLKMAEGAKQQGTTPSGGTK